MFASQFGTPVDARNILRAIQIAAQRAGMSDIRVHTLRHSAAVAWLESGVHVKGNTARAAVEGLAGRLGLLD